MRFTIDTNILVYAVDTQAGDRHRTALDVLARARGRDCVLTVQVLGELFRALTGRHKVPASHAAAMVQAWRDALPVVAADDQCLVDAMDAVTAHNWSFWDAMIWATAKRAGCRVLITEDGQDGRTLGGVTLVNPFAPVPSPLLLAVLDGPKP
ncbi:MAG: PIN domain-containing protein [Azospirillaceae bacterium]|nr:PIN domain-containing protein [Azospirillaceae bacterium]